jgi:membrane protein YdbS with pleckstrin-like domain
MEKFTNESIDLESLPKFEEVIFTPLQKNYFNVLVFNLIVSLLISILVYVGLELITKDSFFKNSIILIPIGLILIFSIMFLFVKLGFKKRGFAIRNHDIIYRSGIISENTIIVPYNRVQHVAIHRGFISRKLNLATIQLYTAGENSADIKIPGLLDEEAIKIKELVSSKINLQQQFSTDNHPNE